MRPPPVRIRSPVVRAAFGFIVAAGLLGGPVVADGLVDAPTSSPALSPTAWPATQPATMPSGVTADDVWQRLVSPDFVEREQATRELWTAGEPVRARLTAEAQTGGLDKRERCRRVLWLIDLGVDPSMPPDIVDAAAGYDYAAPDQERYRRVQMLRTDAQKGSPLLLRLGLREPDPQVRQLIFSVSSPAATTAYVDSLINVDRPDLDAIDAYARAYDRADPDGGPRTLGLCVLRATGRLEAEITRLQASDLAEAFTADRSRLARLLCVARRDAEAVPAAGEDLPLARALLIRNADWPALFKTFEGVEDSDSEVPAAALCQRLVGNNAAADDRLRIWAAKQPTRRDEGRRFVAGRMLLAGLPAAGVDYWATLPDGVGVLRAAGRWTEGMALIDTKPKFPQERLQADRDALRRDTGELPPLPPVRGVAAKAAAAAPAESWQADWQTATSAMAKKDFAAVLAAADRVIAVAPDEAAARLLRAIALEALNRPDDAKAARLATELRCAARWRTWLTMIDRLDNAGLADLADAEAERMLRAQPDVAEVVSNLGNRNARRATVTRDWAAAARSYDQTVLTHLLSSVTYVDPAANVRTAYQRNYYHARAAMAAGDGAALQDYLQRAAAYFPVDGSLSIEFVPQLTAAGDPATADALFDPIWARMTDLCRDFPKAARLRNTAAWTALRCDRHLPEALKLAEEAIALHPGDAATLDTLAEALFRAGRQDEAVARMRESVKALPDDPILQQRLAAFESGQIIVPPEPE